MKFTWKIISINCDSGIIVSAKYFASASDGENFVETEGNCIFSDLSIKTPFDQIEHDQVVEWVKKEYEQDDQNSIELMLQKQLEALKIQKTVTPPWVKPTFKPTL
jgi:hypothetical protein